MEQTFGQKITEGIQINDNHKRVKELCAELIDIISDTYNNKRPMTDAEVELFNTALVKILKAEDAIAFAISSTL